MGIGLLEKILTVHPEDKTISTPCQVRFNKMLNGRVIAATGMVCNIKFCALLLNSCWQIKSVRMACCL